MIATFNPAYWGSWTKFNGYDSTTGAAMIEDKVEVHVIAVTDEHFLIVMPDKSCRWVPQAEIKLGAQRG